MKHIDAVTKSQKTLVDVGSFYHSQATVTSLSSPFRACKINKGKFSDLDLSIYARIFLFIFNNNLENSMGPRRRFICPGGFLGSISVTIDKQLKNLIRGMDLNF